MYTPPSPRPRPKVAIPSAPAPRAPRRSPFPSWLPDPNTPTVHDEPYDDDADTPLQRTTSDSAIRHHGSRHTSFKALPPVPAGTTANFLTEQPYTPGTSASPPQSLPQSHSYSNLYYPPSYEFAQQRPASFAEGTSSYNPNGGSMSFPEPDLQRSFSARSYHHDPPPHRHSSSDYGPSVGLARSTSYAASFSDVGTPRVSCANPPRTVVY